MFPSAAIAKPQTLVFDTGPLWELVLYKAVHPLGFASLKSQLQHLRSDSFYQKLSGFIASFPKRTTTPHVVAEISWRITRTERKGRSAIWGLVYSEFSSMGMDEGVMKLLEMPQELVADIGAVDVSIVELGRSLGPQKSLVLSIDSALIAECQRAGLNARHLVEVIANGEPS
jgi:hypothetical protein